MYKDYKSAEPIHPPQHSTVCFRQSLPIRQTSLDIEILGIPSQKTVSVLSSKTIFTPLYFLHLRIANNY